MGRVIKITEEQLERVFKTKLVNCNSMRTSIYKYMKLSRVLEMLGNKEITFVSPELWYDPFETKYLETDYSAIGYIRPQQIYCFCARADNASEEASWRMYSNSQDDPLIRLSIKVFEFLNYLKEFALQNNCQIYFSKVDYNLTAMDIAGLYKPDNKYHADFFDNFDEEKYIKVMSLKRQAFKYENEIRLFFLLFYGNPIGDSGLLRIPIDFDMFSRYTFAPLERIKGDDISNMLKLEFYKSKLDITRKKIKELDKGTPFYKSILYNETERVNEILR